MTWIVIILMMVLIAGVIGMIFAASRTPSGEHPYRGEAPHRGKVVRFTGTSGHVVKDSGHQRKTSV